jgi:hypothetical protein
MFIRTYLSGSPVNRLLQCIQLGILVSRRLLFRSAPLNERFVEELVCQVLFGVKVRAEPLTRAFKRTSRTKPKPKDRMDGQLTLDEIAKRSV